MYIVTFHLNSSLFMIALFFSGHVIETIMFPGNKRKDRMLRIGLGNGIGHCFFRFKRIRNNPYVALAYGVT